MTIRLKPFRNLTFSCCLAMLAASCSNMTDDDTALPHGKYPMTFTAAVDGLTATRAAGKDTWQENDEIAVSTDDGNTSNNYKITSVSAGGSPMAPTSTPCYWRKNTGQRILAWYPAAGVSNVDISNQSNGFAGFDYLTADFTTDFSAAAVNLPFIHQMAKVTYTLTADANMNTSDLSSATVQIYSYTAVSFFKGVLSGYTNGWITPHTDKEALVVPQQMQGQKFIKVTWNGVDYYYTPAGDDDANLEAGKQYTYNITVKKSELEVKKVTALWNDTSSQDGDATAATLKVHFPDNHGQALTFEGITQEGGSNIYTINNNGNTFSLSYSITDFAAVKGFPVTKGVCDMKRTYSTQNENGTNTYTYTYTNIRSDLWLAYDTYGEVGDFYCKNDEGDGYVIPGGVASLTSEQKNACLGIVYWLGDIKGDNYTLLDSKFPNGTHGLVVSLWDMPAPDKVSSITMTWTYGSYEYVNTWLGSAVWSGSVSRPGSFTSIQVEDKMQGYANTVALKEYNKYIEGQSGEDDYEENGKKRVKPVKGLAAFQTSHPAPSNSSGWYWPSVMELKYMCWGQNNGQGTSGKEMLNTQIEKVVDGSSFGNGDYWSSTENSYNGSRAWYVYCYDGRVDNYGSKNDGNRLVRPLFAY